ncbi:MAG: hypothetical protein AAF526_03590 [Pseudomonadota bacterium]
MRSILNSPKKRRGLNADEIEAMDAFIRGGPVGNVLSMVGKLSPTAGTLPLAANFGAAALEPTALAATAAAAGARGGGDAITKLNADILSAILAGGSVPRASASPSTAAAVRAVASETGDKR